MILLAADTSTLTTSVAVLEGVRAAPPDAVVRAAGESAAIPASDNLMPLVERALAGAGLELAGLDGFAIGAGPGSFTGLRIGMATIKGLAFAAGRPLWAVSSLQALALDALASGAAQGTLIAAVVDARRAEVFAGWFQVRGGTVIALGPERVLSPAALVAWAAELPPGPRLLAGDGAIAYAAELAAAGSIRADLRTTPSAESVGRLALSMELPDVLATGGPAYIRPAEAELKFPQGNPGGTFSTGEGGKSR